MGLFIGASILTILELFDYAYEVGLKTPLKLLITSANLSFTGSCSFFDAINFHQLWVIVFFFWGGVWIFFFCSEDLEHWP